MKTKKKSLYESKIEILKTQNETESKTIKELLSPAAFEKLKKAQSALPQVTTHQRKSRDFNCFMSNETESKTIKDLLSPATFDRLKKAQSALPQIPTHRRKLRNFNGFMSKEAPQVQLRKSVKRKPKKEVKIRKRISWGRKLNEMINAEVKELFEEVIETVEKEAELQGGLDKIEKEAGESQFAFTTKPQSFKVETKEIDHLDGCALESYELWEPKVELLEVEEDVQLPHLSNFAEKPPGLKDPKENVQLSIAYVSLEQLSRLVGIQQDLDNSEEGTLQIFQLTEVPEEGMSGLIEIQKDPENGEEVPFSYFPVDQQSTFYV